MDIHTWSGFCKCICFAHIGIEQQNGVCIGVAAICLLKTQEDLNKTVPKVKLQLQNDYSILIVGEYTNELLPP
jgi:hypothetical protein